MLKGRILIIDDEEIVRVSCQRILAPEGYDIDIASSGDEAFTKLAGAPFDLVLSDLKLPDTDGIAILKRVREAWPAVDVIIMTGYGTVKTAVQAMQIGAFDYIEKPFIPEELTALVSKALIHRQLSADSHIKRDDSLPHYELGNIIGVSEEMQKVFHLIARVAPTGSTVLITGESGTGKELVAKAIHYNSPRKQRPFVVVDCTAIPATLIESELFGHAKGAFTGAHEKKQGLLELASSGTLFFDEIGNLDPAVQAKLLRVLQEKEFRPVGDKKTVQADIRFISATNKDLHRMTKDGSFREDFFFRLNIFPIHVPPLRERKEDIPHLVRHFLQTYSRELGKKVTHVTAEAMRLLISFDWPGNVRQLENVIQRAIILCQDRSLKPEHFETLETGAEEVPQTIDDLKKRKRRLRLKSVEEIERAFLLDALRRNAGNISKAASDVGMQRTNFHTLMKKHGITKPEKTRGREKQNV